MTQEVLDIVALLPPELRRRACALSDQLAGRMRAEGHFSHFQLDRSYEPHVSLFMLVVDEHEIDDVVRTARSLAADLPVLAAEGERYQHNPEGAPELYFRKSTEWIELQRMVLAEVEPLRRGRLRETAPSGALIVDVLNDPREDPVRRSQLVRFGYDEVTEEWNPAGGGPDDRFNPHVTLAWPADPAFRVDLSNLPPAREFSGVLTELAVYGMSTYGTCTRPYGTAPLGVSDVTASSSVATPSGT